MLWDAHVHVAACACMKIARHFPASSSVPEEQGEGGGQRDQPHDRPTVQHDQFHGRVRVARAPHAVVVLVGREAEGQRGKN